MLKENIENIPNMYTSKDYHDAATLAYYDIITTMKETALSCGVDLKEISLDIINEEDLLK